MGLLSFLFGEILKKKVEDNEGLISDIKDEDNYLDETKKWIKWQQKTDTKFLII